MNLIPVILILVAIVSLCYFSTPFFISTSRQRNEKLVRQLSIAGAANNLTFCSQEILQNMVIGIDGIHRKIMVMERKDDGYHSSIILLDDVNECQVVSNSRLVRNGYVKKMDDESRSGTLELRFGFHSHTQQASIIFSNGAVNSKKEFAFLKAKAEYWCVMFLKMLNPQIKARA